MDKLLKIFYLFALLYLVWQLGRWYGRIEAESKYITPLFESRVEKYNEIMLRNCLMKNYKLN